MRLACCESRQAVSIRSAGTISRKRWSWIVYASDDVSVVYGAALTVRIVRPVPAPPSGLMSTADYRRLSRRACERLPEAIV